MGGGGGNPLFEPFYDSMRIAVPLAINANNLEAQKNRTDQLFEANRQKLLEEVKQSRDKVAMEASSKILQKTLESIDPNNPESIMAAKGQALRFESMLGKPIFGRDESGEIMLPGIKPEKTLGYGSSPLGIYDKGTGNVVQPVAPKTEYDIKDTENGLMFIPKQPGQGAPIPVGVRGKQPVSQTTQQRPPAGYESNPSGEGLRPIPGGPADKPSQGVKPPSGYRMSQDGNAMEAIPGGPADQKTQQSIAKDQVVRDYTFSELDRLKSAATEIRDHPGLTGISGIQGKFPNIPGGEAADAEALFETLKSQIAFSVLQNMRNNSKTGGALGQVSEKEIKFLENNLAALDKPQSYKAMKASLDKIVKYVDESKARIQSAYDAQYGSKAAGEDISTMPDDLLKKQLGITK